MRIVLGVLLLLVGFVAAVWLRQAFTSAAREESERSFGEAELDLAPIPEGWGRAIVGAKSGVPPLPEDEVRALPAFKKADPKLASDATPRDATVGPAAKESARRSAPGGGSTTPATEATADARGEPRSAGKPASHIVLAGETLGRICARHYGTSEKALVSAVARANDLASPDAIKVGQVLRLPPREELR